MRMLSAHVTEHMEGKHEKAQVLQPHKPACGPTLKWPNVYSRECSSEMRLVRFGRDRVKPTRAVDDADCLVYSALCGGVRQSVLNSPSRAADVRHVEIRNRWRPIQHPLLPRRLEPRRP